MFPIWQMKVSVLVHGVICLCNQVLGVFVSDCHEINVCPLQIVTKYSSVHYKM